MVGNASNIKPGRFDGVVLITGATAGIGRATALAFGAAGARVMAGGRNEQRGRDLVDQIVGLGGEADFVAADVASPADVNHMVKHTLDRFGGLDAAFNNAGLFDRMHDFHTYEPEAWHEMLSVNLTGVFLCMQAQIAAMLDTGGSIINNASTVAHRGSERASPAYVAAKHGVLGLTRQAALQYADRNIRVNAVSPGPTATAMAQPLIDEGPEAVHAALSTLNPVAQFVDPADIAATVLFLCSPAAAMINGHALPLDGGQLAKL